MTGPAHGTAPSAPSGPTRFFLASLLLLAFGLLLHPLGDPDVYIHLRDGRYWVESGLHVGNEPFAYTAADQPMEKVEWLFRVLWYGLWRLGGLNGLIVVKAAVMTAALGLLGLLIWRRWSNLAGMAVLLALAVVAPMHRIFPERPYIFTYLFLPLALLWLDRFRRGGPEPAPRDAERRLWLLPPLTVLWANLHPGFVVVFAFLGSLFLETGLAYWKQPSPETWRRLRTLALVSAGVLLAGAVNPLGFGLYRFIYGMMGSSEFMKYILEWAPPTLAGQPVFFALLGAAGAVFLLTWNRARLYDWLPAAVFGYLAVKSYRNIPLFLIAALPPLAGGLGQLRSRWFPRLALNAPWRRRALTAGGVLVLAGLAGLAATGWAFRLGEIPRFYPAGGLAWLEAHPLQGRLLTHDIWGGYTGWITHGKVKVFMDGRLPTFGEKLYADYRAMIWGDPQRCLPLLQRYAIEGVLVSPKNDLKLFQRLWESGDWALVYWDDVSLLYVRRDGRNRSLVERFAYRDVDPKHNPFFNQEQPEQALAEVRRAAATAPDSFLPKFLLGDLLLRSGDLEGAERAFTETLELSPGHPGTHFQLALLARRQRRPDKADYHLRQVVRHTGRGDLYGQACFALAQLAAEDPARRGEARAWAARAVKALPQWEEARRLAASLGGS